MSVDFTERTSYLSDDEDLISNDSDVDLLVEQFKSCGLGTQKIKSTPDSDENFPTLSKQSIPEPCPSVIQDEEITLEDKNVINQSSKCFPTEYSFILEWDNINEFNIRSHPELFNLIFGEWYTPQKLIEQQIAMVSLYWANLLNTCKVPIIENTNVTFQSLLCSSKNKRLSRHNIYLTIELPKFKEGINSKTKSLKKGMSLKLTCSDETFYAVVYRISISKSIAFAVLSDDCVTLPEIGECKRCNVYEEPDSFVTEAMLKSIKYLKMGALNNLIMPSPRFTESLDSYLTCRDRNKSNFLSLYIPNLPSTPAQKNSIYAMARKEHGDQPFILNGPPGTGKTFTFSVLIQILLKINTNNRVLVCTPSNMAADQLAKKLMENFGTEMNKNNVIRLNSTGRDFEHRDQSFDEITFIDLEEKCFKIPKFFGSYRVVVCSLGCVSHLCRRVSHGFFSHIIIDEAGQCSEAEMWIPIGGLATAETSIIMGGDPKQLGPVVTLDVSPLLAKRLQSPLTRYLKMECYKNDQRLGCLLTDCFRCPPNLVHWVSSVFYENRLKPISLPIDDVIDFSSLGIPKLFPIFFVHVEGFEEREPGGMSFGNKLEAKVILEFTERIIREKKIPSSEIGIICPYRYQSYLILQKIKNHRFSKEFKNITVDSVERFQGSERSCILLSTIRSNSLGFVADDLRLNTSLTRAKDLLIVVGNELALRRHHSWRLFITYCKNNLGYVRWNGFKFFGSEMTSKSQ